MIDQKYCDTLELHKVLERLAEQASCADSAEKIRAIVPETRLSNAQRLVRETADAYMLIRRFGGPTILRVKNPASPLKRASSEGVLSMRELLDVAEVLRNIRGLHDWHERSVDVPTALDEYFGCLSPNKYLEDRINNSILTEEEMADTASPALYDIRNKIRRALARAKDQLDKMLKSQTYQKFFQENLVTIRDGRYVIPVKAEARNEIKGLVHDVSASGQTLFIEPMGVVEANNEVRELQSREQAEMERILRELSSEAGSFADSILHSYWALIELDVLFAKAQLGYKMKASEPLLSDDGVVELKKARHPLIDPDKVVPIDIGVGDRFDTLVITGPNTGGKTVALKTLGLLSLMAMCGLMVPAADESRLSVFEHVLVDIGDEQSIEQSLSTFSSHMTNLVSIMEVVDSSSLVLLDELGAGTDPIEGAALATAILEKLSIFGCRIAATTHYAELKIYAMQNERVENACCEFDVETLRPTYRLLMGLPGKSNAFAISERLGMNPSVISRARALVSDESTDFEQIIGDLQGQLTEAQKARQQADAERAAASRMKKEMDDLRRKFDAERDRELENARQRAKKLIADVQAQSDLLLREVDALLAQKEREDFAQLAQQAKQQMKQKFKKLRLEADPLEQAVEPERVNNNRPVRVGDVVKIAGLNQQGEVIAVDGKTATVVAGIIKTKIHVDQLQIVGDNRSISFEGAPERTVRLSNPNLRAEIDLRGKNVDEAIMELDQYLDGAVMSGLPSITIIHGKGTGALRTGIHQHLKRHKNVRSFRLGVYGEGESGVTVVELK